MPANYVLGFVQRDGNEHDYLKFGTDLASAVEQLHIAREDSNPHHTHWFVYDADDPERGYFSPDD